MKKIIVFSTNDDGTVEYLDEKQKNNPHLIEKQLKMDHGLKRNQKTKQNKTLVLQNF